MQLNRKFMSNKRAGLYALSGLVVIAVFLALLFLGRGVSSYSLNCTFTPTASCNNLSVVLLKNASGGYDNAHAQNTSVNTYPNSLCCYSDASLTPSCAQTVLFRLSNETNAHVQIGNYTGNQYNVSVCISSTQRQARCVYSSGSCASGFNCIASMASPDTPSSNLTNAHLGECGEYNLKVCCKINNPPNVTLTNPSDGYATTNRTPMFNWTASDPDGDSIVSYQINLTTFLDAGSTSLCTDSRIDTTSNQYYIPTSDLSCLKDNGVYYQWSVRATDGLGYGNWTTPRVINITALITISLPIDKVEFFTLGIGKSNDTTTNAPMPFEVQNDGNAFVNINISATPLWQSVGAPNQYFQYKIGNVSGEAGAFNWTGSLTTFTNISTTGNPSINRLNYSDLTDIARTDIFVQVPSNEPPAVRNSTVTFTSYLAET
jgi:hypothetical protein